MNNLKLQAGNGIVLELIHGSHAAALCGLRNANTEHLGHWLPWVQHMQTVADFEDFIRNSLLRYYEQLELPLTIVVNGTVAGRIGLNHFNHANSHASIGYWLGQAFEGKGIITQACRCIMAYGFNELQLNRLELRCGTGNHRSQAVAERLGFIKEGIVRQGERVNGQFIDLSLYSMLRQDWAERQGSELILY